MKGVQRNEDQRLVFYGARATPTSFLFLYSQSLSIMSRVLEALASTECVWIELRS